MFIVLSNITFIKDLQKDLEQANRLVSLGTMATGIVYEINDPLSVIRVYTELMESRWMDEKFRFNYVDSVGKQVKIKINNVTMD